MQSSDRSKRSTHHIIPKSRGGGLGDNLVDVSMREHQFYHALFGNRTPEEIVRYLNKRFWADKYSGLEVQMEKYAYLNHHKA